MNDTTQVPLLGEFSSDELEQLIALVRQFKGRFSAVAADMITAARQQDVGDNVIHASIVTQCLILAAWMPLARATLFYTPPAYRSMMPSAIGRRRM